MGTPQGKKLGPILRFICCNGVSFDGCSKVQYADDTTLHQEVGNVSDNVAGSIEQAQWSVSINMILNDIKIVILNVAFTAGEGTDILPSASAIFL